MINIYFYTWISNDELSNWISAAANYSVLNGLDRDKSSFFYDTDLTAINLSWVCTDVSDGIQQFSSI